MTRIFAQVLDTAMRAGWLVLAVLVLRLVLRKVPKGIVCLLWALVAVRLLLPFSIESDFSLIPDTDPVSRVYQTQQAPLAPQTQTPPDTPSLSPASVEPASAGSRSVPFAAVWLCGIGAMELYALISMARLRRQVRASIVLEGNVRLCDEIDSPFILGLLFPKIYLPSNLPQEDRVSVLAHERAHLKRKDHWWKPLGFALLSVYWFHPLMWVAYLLLCRDIEMACDEQVVRVLDGPGRRAYSQALLRCGTRPRHLHACPLAFGEVGVKKRIQRALQYRKPALWVVSVSLALCAVVAVCFLTDPKTEVEAKTISPEPVRQSSTMETRNEPLQEWANSWSGGSIRLFLPSGWECQWVDSGSSFGYAFRPEGQREGWIKLLFWPEGFGICGTGLETKTMTLACGEVCLGYYDGNSQWDYLVYQNMPGSYTVTREGAGDWWPEYEAQTMALLGAVRLAEGMKTQSEILEIAQSVLEDYARQAVLDADEAARSLMGEEIYTPCFDSGSGLWSVSLYFMIDSSPRAMVWLDAQGQVLSSGAGMVPMPQLTAS